MHRLTSGLKALMPLALVAVAAGCNSTPIGDPCVPESIPPGGFDSREIYLETSSVQCRTRVCMVYQLDGDPENICEGGGPAGCIEQDTVNNQVFCSCRCSVTDGSQANTPLCDCGDGFECIDDIVTTGGAGVRGGYCVPCIREGNPDNLDVTLFNNCPAE